MKNNVNSFDGFELVTIEECYPDKCLLPGGDRGGAGCFVCKDVKLRPLTSDEIGGVLRIAKKIGCNDPLWIAQAVRDRSIKIKDMPVRLRPIKRKALTAKQLEMIGLAIRLVMLLAALYLIFEVTG